MIRILSMRALPQHRLYLKFSDGAEGTVDLSDLISEGVFADLKDEDKFAEVRLASSRRSLVWNNEIDLCADALYLHLTGKAAQELFPRLAHEEGRYREHGR